MTPRFVASHLGLLCFHMSHTKDVMLILVNRSLHCRLNSQSFKYHFLFLLAAMTVGKGGIDSLTLHVGMLGIAGLVTVTFPFYSGAVCM